MALPNQFTTKTDATGGELDANFSALGRLTPIPCGAAGNAPIVLTPGANTPSVLAYSNYMQFTGVAAQTNPGADTAKVGALNELPIYKASPAGPVALTGGEIVAGCGFSLLYDASLNAASGGFHLMGAAGVSLGGGSISGPIVGVGSLASITYPVGVFPMLSGVTLASISRMSVGGGHTISRILHTLASISMPALPPQTGTLATVLLAGSSINDIVSFGFPPNASIGISFKGFVIAPGTIGMQAFNGTAATLTPATGTYGVQAIGY